MQLGIQNLSDSFFWLMLVHAEQSVVEVADTNKEYELQLVFTHNLSPELEYIKPFESQAATQLWY